MLRHSAHKLFPALISWVCLTSCVTFHAGTQKRAEDPLHDVVKLVHPATGKEVIYVSMQHLSSRDGYARLREYLDGRKAEGYVTFCEGVIPVPFHIDTLCEINQQEISRMEFTFSTEDSLRLDTLYRKCRRMLGFMTGVKGYADPDNKSLIIKNKEYVSQRSDLLGLTTEQDLWVDYSLRDIVEVCERKYGEIPLTAYDWQTGLFEQYQPEEQSPQIMRSYFTVFARNNYLVRRIVESPRQKIVVVYGAGHYFGVIGQLKNNGFRKERHYKAER